MIGAAIGFLGESIWMGCDDYRIPSSTDCFLVGSIIGDIFDVELPFKVAFCSFVLSFIFVVIFTPYVIMPDAALDGTPTAKGIGAFFAPLKILGPQKMRLADGKALKSWSITFLTLGVFLGVVS